MMTPHIGMVVVNKIYFSAPPRNLLANFKL